MKNPIYIGKTRHKDKIYDGQHEAIISEDVWNGVQERLSGQAAAPRGHKKDPEKNLLKGLLFDCDGTPYSPDYTKKKSGKTYRYYISQNLIQYRDHPKGVMARLPATEIEKAISHALHNHFKNTDLLCETLNFDHLSLHSAVEYITSNLPSGEGLVRVCLDKVTIDQDNLSLKIDLTKLTIYLNKTLDLTLPAAIENFYTLSIPFTTRRAHKGAIIISPDNQNQDLTDLPPTELKNLLRGIIWRDEHFNGTSIRAIARREELSESGIRKIIMRSFDTLLSL